MLLRRPLLSRIKLAVAVSSLALVAGVGVTTPAVSSEPAPMAGPAVGPIGTAGARPAPGSASPTPAGVVDEGLDLRAGPVAVPLELHVPTIGLRATVLGVGITSEEVMDAPMGAADDPVWQQAFWYRGSAIPGSASTALIAGHVGGPGGRPAVFTRIGELRPGDPIVVRDTRSGVQVSFAITETSEYSIDQTRDPRLLARIYGTGPVAGTDPQPSPDGLSRLTLITCSGTFVNGTHDHRLVVFASRST